MGMQGGTSGSGKPQSNFPSPQYGMPSQQGGGQRGYAQPRQMPNPMLNQQGPMGVRNLGGPTQLPALGTTGGNMAPPGMGGAPPGMVADPTRTGGVRPWDAPGFDPTHGGPFYKPAPGAPTNIPQPGQTPGIVPPMQGGQNQQANAYRDPRSLSPIGKGNMPQMPGAGKPGKPPAMAQQLPAAPQAPAGPDMSWQGGN